MKRIRVASGAMSIDRASNSAPDPFGMRWSASITETSLRSSNSTASSLEFAVSTPYLRSSNSATDRVISDSSSTTSTISRSTLSARSAGAPSCGLSRRCALLEPGVERRAELHCSPSLRRGSRTTKVAPSPGGLTSRDGAAVIGDHGVSDAESQARSRAHRFRGEERFKDALGQIARHSRAVVPDS